MHLNSPQKQLHSLTTIAAVCDPTAGLACCNFVAETMMQNLVESNIVQQNLLTSRSKMLAEIWADCFCDNGKEKTLSKSIT